MNYDYKENNLFSKTKYLLHLFMKRYLQSSKILGVKKG